jgi:gliding motility-associated-like protein
MFTPDAGQCATTATLSITVTTSIVPTFNAIAPLCPGSTAPVLPATSLNGISGTWNPAVISTATPGITTYTFTPDAGQCGTPTTLGVTVNALPTASFAGNAEICAGAAAQLPVSLSGRGPWTITYSDGTTERTINNITASTYQLTVRPTTTTQYTITRVTDANCANLSVNSVATVTVNQAEPGVRLPTVNAYANFPVQLQARNLGTQYTYQWLPGTGLSSSVIQNPVFSYDRSIEYRIRMTSAEGCDTEDVLLVNVVNNNDPSAKPDLLVPNAWTPNGDGHNDQLFPFTINIRQLVYFRVFNRWGQLMYETKQLGQGWDGMYRGEKQPIDVYTWTAEAIGNDGSVIRKSGNAALLR